MANTKEWYKKPWGMVVAFLILPFFIIWYAWAKSSWNKLAKVGVTVLVVFIMMAALGSQQPQQQQSKTTTIQSAKPTQQTATTPQTTTPRTTKPATTQDQLWTAVDNGLKKRDNIKIDYDGTDKVAFIEHTDNDPYDAVSFVRQTYAMLALWGPEAFKVSGVDIINIQNKTTFKDQYGNNSTGTGVTIEMTKDQFSKFNWKNLEYSPINDAIQNNSNVYIIVPAIRNEIKDPSKLYLVLRYP